LYAPARLRRPIGGTVSAWPCCRIFLTVGGHGDEARKIADEVVSEVARTAIASLEHLDLGLGFVRPARMTTQRAA
jgi:hypothetical protein